MGLFKHMKNVTVFATIWVFVVGCEEHAGSDEWVIESDTSTASFERFSTGPATRSATVVADSSNNWEVQAARNLTRKSITLEVGWENTVDGECYATTSGL